MRIATAPQSTPAAPATPAPSAAHMNDPLLANVLYDAWAGDPLITVSSPPGAGKTRLIAHLADHLYRRASLRVAIATQTNVQALDLANRIDELGCTTNLLGGSNTDRPAALRPTVRYNPGARQIDSLSGVVIANTVRWQWTSPTAWKADVLLVDEAYQCTYASLCTLGSLADQIVLVGDPGQIDPVVTGSTHRWSGQGHAPHRSAPDALIDAYGDVVTQHRMDKTWRCGPVTTDLIKPFYPGLPFTSARPDMHLVDEHGTALPELTATTLTPSSEIAPLIAQEAADRVRTLLRAHLVENNTTTAPLLPTDIAVVTAHVNQAATIAGYLSDLDGLLIGTANSLQGAERTATVVIHPMLGRHEVTEFGLDLGRTCVALTRHRAHTTVLVDARTVDLLDQARHDHPHAATQHQVLTTLTTG